MSVIRRVRDITIATLNEMLEQSEDPVRLIDEYLAAQRDQIIQTEKLLQQMINHAHSLRRQVEAAEQLKQKREHQAMVALKAGEEHVARLALQEKMQQEEKYEQFSKLYDEAKHSIVELEDQLERLKRDYDEVLSKRQYYMARLESIRLQQRMNERLKSVGPGYSGSAFRRLEERISDLEMETKALRDLRRAGQEWGRAISAASRTLEQELEQLRLKLEKEGWFRT